MPLMTNAEAFRYDFGIYATELWAMTEAQFLEWLNADCDRKKPNAVHIVRCKDCRWYENDGYHTNCKIMRFCVEAEDYCSRGERREDDNK